MTKVCPGTKEVFEQEDQPDRPALSSGSGVTHIVNKSLLLVKNFDCRCRFAWGTLHEVPRGKKVIAILTLETD